MGRARTVPWWRRSGAIFTAGSCFQPALLSNRAGGQCLQGLNSPYRGLLFLQPLAPKGCFGQKKLLLWGVWEKKKASAWGPVVTLSYANGKGWENLRAPHALVLQSDIKHSAWPRELIYFTRKPFIQCCPLRKMIPWLIFLFEMLIWVTASHLSHVQKKKQSPISCHVRLLQSQAFNMQADKTQAKTQQLQEAKSHNHKISMHFNLLNLKQNSG